MKRTLACLLLLICAAIAATHARAVEPCRTTDRSPRDVTSGGRAGDQRDARGRENPVPWLPSFELAGSLDQRDMAPEVPPGDIDTLVAGHTAFALDLYRHIRNDDGNVFFSPYSISTALSMTYAGARGETARQIAEALHFDLAAERLHPAVNALDLALARRGEGLPADPPELVVANSMWGQQGFAFREDFLRVLATHYGAGVRLLDFEAFPEPARAVINKWIAERTDGQIDELLQDGDVTPLTRFVMTNAILFKASWLSPFAAAGTVDRDFHRLDGGIVQVPTMQGEMYVGYQRGKGYEAVEMAYVGGDLSMVVIAPDLGEFTRFERELSPERLRYVLSGLRSWKVRLSLPKFDFKYGLNLNGALSDLGMPIAFSDLADFSGVTTAVELNLSAALHQAFVAVDEKGTSAGAATAVVGSVVVSVPPPLHIDRPFVFLIRDRPTGAILFLGRVVDPGSS